MRHLIKLIYIQLFNSKGITKCEDTRDWTVIRELPQCMVTLNWLPYPFTYYMNIYDSNHLTERIYMNWKHIIYETKSNLYHSRTIIIIIMWYYDIQYNDIQ